MSFPFCEGCQQNNNLALHPASICTSDRTLANSTALICGQSKSVQHDVPLVHYVQKLEQENTILRKKLQEYETTNSLLQPSLNGSRRSGCVEAAPISASSQQNSVYSPLSPTSTDSGDASTSSHSEELDWTIEYNPEVVPTLEVNLIRTITDEDGAYRIKISPDGQLLAMVARMSQVVKIYSVATGVKTCVLEDLYIKESRPGTNDLCFCPNNKYLATCTEKPENIIKIWDVHKKLVQKAFEGHFRSIYALDFSPDGRLLISGSTDSTVRIWNMRDGSSRIFHDSSSDISSVRFCPDGRHVVAGNWDGQVLIWELRSGHLVALLKRHDAVVSSIVLLPNGKGLISSSHWHRSLNYWDISGLESSWILGKKRPGTTEGAQNENLTFAGHTNRIRSISISSDGRWLVSGSHDKTVRVWNTGTGMQQCVLRGHKSDVYSVDFNRAGHYLASADLSGTVLIWSYKLV